MAKFAAAVVDTGGKFAAGVVVTEGNLPPVSLTPVANLRTLCFWPDSEPTKLLQHPKRKLPVKIHLGIGVFKVPSSMATSTCMV